MRCFPGPGLGCDKRGKLLILMEVAGFDKGGKQRPGEPFALSRP